MEEIRSLLCTQASQNQNEASSIIKNNNSFSENIKSSHHSYSTRISKVEFPRFDGKRMKEWLYKCDQFFMLDGTPAESKVRLASIHLDGIALQWHLNYMRNKFDIYPPWQQYVTDVTMRFGEIYDDPLSSLIQVKQSGTIQDYVDEFELALT
uniref:Retrotransposon gag domain-containing protein n=1 Tax=Cajanus cajan TaxID=3821 RepID=A0A151SYB6_CAJCA|nr:hypothetical protein KK1_015219 [Cajanus cajan]